MRILFFSTSYPNPLQPRIGSFNHSLLQALADEHAVRVIAPISWVSELAAYRQCGQRMPAGRRSFSGGIPADHPRYYYVPKLAHTQLARTMEWSCRPTLETRIREFRPDAILSYWSDPDGRVALRAARRHGLPSVTMVGGSDVLILGRHGRRRAAIYSVLRHSDAVVAVSDDIAQTIVDGGVSPERVSVVRRGVNKTVFTPGNRVEARNRLGIDLHRKTCVFVGRLVPVKGLSTLISAAQLLRRQGIDFACYVCGEGPLRGRLEAEVQSRGLEGFVHFVGSQPQQQLADWYRAADVTVLPSLSEGVPNVLMESLCCGTPFVASHVGGIPEIADPQHDRLVPAGHVEQWAAALKEQFDRPRSHKQRIFQPLTWPESAAQLARVTERAIGKPIQSLSPLDQTTDAQTVPATDDSSAGFREFAETT